MEGDYWTELVRQTENIRHFESRVLSVRTAGNSFMMRSSGNSSFTTKSCACVSVAFLAGNISWSVENNYSCQLYSFVDCRKRSYELTYRICSNAGYVHTSNDSRIYLQSSEKSLEDGLQCCFQRRGNVLETVKLPLHDSLVYTRRMKFTYPRTVLNSHCRSTSTQITATRVRVVTPPRMALKFRRATNQD